MRARFSRSLVVGAGLLVAAACSLDPQARLQRHLTRGDAYVAEGKVAEAIIEYRNAVQADSRSSDARVKLADAYARNGDGPNALNEYVRAADLLPTDSAVQLKASSLLLLASRFDDSRLWAEKVLEREPQNLDALILLANSLAGLKDLDRAVAEIEEAIQINPDRGATYSNLGAIELQRGNKDAAEKAFLKAVALDGNSAAVRLALANFYWSTAQFPDAEAQLKKVVELEPTNVTAHRFLASFYTATNRGAEAEPHVVKVRELTKSPEAAFALADYYVAQRNEKSARDVLMPLANESSTAATAEVKLAILDRRQGDANHAYERLARVLERDRTNLNALLVKTSFLLTDQRTEEALETANVAAGSHQQSAAALYALGTVQASRRQVDQAIASYEGVLRVNPRATDAKLALARLQLSRGRPEASVDLAREAVDTNPKSAGARLTLARALIAQKEFPKAEEELNKLAKDLPESAQLQNLFGSLRGLQRNPAAARTHFDRALQLDPDSFEAVSGLVTLDLGAKQHDQARARIDAYVARHDKQATALMLAARTYGSTGDLKQTETFLRRAIQAEPSYLDAYAALAQLYIVQKRSNEALKELESMTKQDPRPVGPYTLMGIIQQGQGNNKEAADHFNRALQLDPEAAVAANNLAWLYAQTDDQLDRALELALRAKARLPERAEVNDTIGWVYYRRGLANEAIPYFQKSLDADVKNPVYHYHLGLARAQAGDVTRARIALERAIALRPDYREAVAAHQTLPPLQ